MPAYKIHKNTTPGAVSLAVADLEMLAAFYEKVIGLHVISRSLSTVDLGVDGSPLVHLIHQPEGKRYPRASGLFHLALLVPARSDLGQWLRHVINAGYPLDGAGDHLVSEALYLHDPEGNGIEVYRDRPRNEWRYEGTQIKMDTLPVDHASLLAEASPATFTHLPAGTIMGHIHLQVDDVNKALAFYRDILGFDVTAQLPGAGFLSAGGYHHHIGVNSWHSRGALPPPQGALGLRGFTLHLPDEDAKNALTAHLERHHIAVTQKSGASYFKDIFQNELVLMA